MRNQVPATDNLFTKMQTDLVRYVYLNTNTAITVSLLCACITFIGFFSLRGSNNALLLWFILYLSVTVFRVVLVHLFESQPNPESNIHFWYKSYIVATACAGAMWGLPAILLMPDANEMQQILMLLILGGVTIGVIPILSPLPAAAILFLFITVTPYIISFAFFSKNIYILFDAALISYLMYSIYLVVKSHEFIKSAIYMQFQNEQLREDLKQTNEQLISSNKKIKEIATHDILTHLATWELFEKKLYAVMEHAKSTQNFVALMYIDLDQFKLINAMHGHHNGNYILLMVVERIKNFFGSDEMIARLGNDEFAIIIENMVDIDAVKTLALQVCELLAKPYHLPNEVSAITASIGISIFPDDGDKVDILLATACNRMAYAKEQGGNHYYLSHAC